MSFELRTKQRTAQKCCTNKLFVKKINKQQAKKKIDLQSTCIFIKICVTIDTVTQAKIIQLCDRAPNMANVCQTPTTKSVYYTHTYTCIFIYTHIYNYIIINIYQYDQLQSTTSQLSCLLIKRLFEFAICCQIAITFILQYLPIHTYIYKKYNYMASKAFGSS